MNICVLLWFILWSGCIRFGIQCLGVADTAAVVSYTVGELCSIRDTMINDDCPKWDLPPEMKRRKRGRRSGVKVRNRHMKHKPVLPSVIMGNVRSIVNKVDELASLVRYDRLYRQCSLLCFTETWLTDCITTAYMEMDGFTMIRHDRDPEKAGKKSGGGVCLYVNNQWCHPGHITEKHRVCDPNIELLAVSCRPYFLPREFTNVIVIVTYIPPSANAKLATDSISRVVHELQSHTTDALVVINGDFNHCTLSASLPSFRQFVNCPTRGEKTIDLFYANIKDSYKSTDLPPLGRSDHNLVLLSSKYTTLARRQPVSTKTVRVWSKGACQDLQDCLECTDWSVFYDEDSKEVDCVTDCVTDYIKFCTDLLIPCKTIKLYSNNKPWITKDIKDAINEKKAAFMSKNKDRIRVAQKNVKVAIRQGKNKYKDRVENKLQECDTKGLWNGLKSITGFGPVTSNLNGETFTPDEANLFYARFDCTVNSTDHHIPAHYITPLQEEEGHPSLYPPVTITVEEVRSQLRKLNVNKAPGPDGIMPRVLKVCADQLCDVLHYLFTLSLSVSKVPAIWKTSCIVPVPKKPNAKALKDLRPIALTSHVMKCFERTILGHLRAQVSAFQDPLQFAYREGVGTDDALIYLLHRVYSHLETSAASVRIMFFDFSSAFNTLQPHILAKKLYGFNLHKSTVGWITDYLTCRPQYVRIQNSTSETIKTNIGAPQGTVLSPFLFTLYTSDCRHSSSSCHLQKFSDDSALVGYINKDNYAIYQAEVDSFVSWCEAAHLILNVDKCKELIIDFRKKRNVPVTILINDRPVDVVTSYKYLGIHLDNKLDWKMNSNIIFKKAQSRLFFLRKLRSFDLGRPILNTFYHGIVASVLFYAVVCWGGNMTLEDRNKLNKLIKKAGSITGICLSTVEQILEERVMRKVNSVMLKDDHPLYSLFVRSGRSQRLLLPNCSTERFRRSFIPAAIRLLNKNC